MGKPYPVPQLTRDVARASEKNVFLHFPLIGIDSKDWDLHITDIINWRYITRSSPHIASKHFFAFLCFLCVIQILFPPGAINCQVLAVFFTKTSKKWEPWLLYCRSMKSFAHALCGSLFGKSRTQWHVYVFCFCRGGEEILLHLSAGACAEKVTVERRRIVLCRSMMCRQISY